MGYLKAIFENNNSWQRAGAIVAFVVVYIMICYVRLHLSSHLKNLAERRQSTLMGLMGRLVEKTHLLFIGLVSVWAASFVLALPVRPIGLDLFDKLLLVTLAVQITIWVHQAINFYIADFRVRNLDTDASAVTTMSALGFLGKLVLYVVAILFVLANLDVEIGPLLAGFGIAGIAVGLALQNILGDLFASLTIILDKPFVIGDFIIVDDKMGTVEHIGLKTTRVKSLSGEQLVFGNSDLLGSRIRNFKRMAERRIVFGFGVVYQTPHEKLATIGDTVREIVQSFPDTRFDRAHFKSFGDSSLDFEAVFYMLKPDYNLFMDTQQAINLALMRRFEEAGIEFAYPTQTLYIQPAGGDAKEYAFGQKD